MRIRRAADAGAHDRGLGIPALLDLHTGREPTPPVCSYASHYPFVNTVWNGEGFDFSGDPAYWLVEVSSRVHGERTLSRMWAASQPFAFACHLRPRVDTCPCTPHGCPPRTPSPGLSGDLLGAPAASAAFKGLMFGMTTRNSDWAPAVWRMWDAVNIFATSDGVYGWWDLEAPPVAVVNSTCGATPNPGSCDWNVTLDGYYDGSPCGAPEGNLRCFSDLSLAAAQAECCNNTSCGGFSFAAATGAGCFKNAHGCFVPSATYHGYNKPGFVPVGGGAVLAATFSAYRSHAVVVVASWCTQATAATLSIDWAALGLDAARVNITAPAISGVQPARMFPNATGPFALAANGGVVLLLQAAGPEVSQAAYA